MKKLTKLITTFAVISAIGTTMLSSTVAAEKHRGNNNSTRYISYDYETGEETIIDITLDNSGVDYVLAESDDEVEYTNSQISPYVVIGDDERETISNTTLSPYKGIGYLSCTKNGTTSRGTCSAFARNAAITAAHVVWDSSNKTCATNINISFGRNGNTFPYGTITEQPVKIIIPEEYKTNGSTQYDYAIILYSEDTTISSFRFGYSKTVTTSTNVNITGYPKDTSTAEGDNASSNSYMQWTHSGTVTAVDSSTIRYTIDTTGGQSGAPVYTNNNIIVAVHHGDNSNYNTAKRIDNDLFSLMKSIREGTYTY